VVNKKAPVLDLAAYTREQIVDAMISPLNHHGTREEHGCSEEEVLRHPDWLFRHYIECGGATAFAKRKSEFERPCDSLESCVLKDACSLAYILSGWRNCPIKNSERCRRCLTPTATEEVDYCI
jgi:hypothetical protein